jgi:ankyrin repeat protein
MIVAQRGYGEVVKLLLGKNGVDSNYRDETGDTPLWCAVRFDHIAVVKLLL